MANEGPNTNTSQFFITCSPAQHLNGRHVVFGVVVAGMSVVRRVEEVETLEGDVPAAPVLISECGIVEEGNGFGIPPSPDGDSFEDYPKDSSPALSNEALLAAALSLKGIGNALFGKALWKDAITKYAKAVRYCDAVGDPDAIAEVSRCRVACLSNTAQCHMNLCDYAEAIAVTTRVLSMSPNHAKCLFRRGTSYAQQKDYDKALNDLRAAQAVDPNDGNIAAVLADVHGRLQIQAELYKQKMKGMFS